MAKKIIKAPEPTPKVKKVVKRNPAEAKKGIEILKQAIAEKPKKTPEPIKEPTLEPIQEPINEPINEPTPEPVHEPINEPVNEPAPEPIQEPINESVNEPTPEPVKADAPALSIWDDIKKGTEEDTRLGATKTILADLDDDSEGLGSLENLANQANGNDNADDENARKQGNLVKAGIVVEIMDVVFMIICLLLTWDFTDDNQKKYTLSKDRKKAIQTNLYKLYELSGKKPNPKKDIWFLILGSYAPMLFVAVLTMIKNLKEKSEAKKRQKVIQQMEIDNAQIINQQNAEIQRQKEYNEALRRELEERDRELIKEIRPTTSQPFSSIPNTGKKPLVKSSGRGVKAGQKRGSYKKKK